MIYLDNGATSFPKPPTVYTAVENYIRYCGASSGRSAHKKARQAMETALMCRMEIANLIGASAPEDIIFTKNATEGLNIIIRGLIKEKDKVIVSPLEHNSVMRPLRETGAEITVLPKKSDGRVDICAIEKLCENCKLVIINHVSNVSGEVNDISLAGEICKKNNIPLVIDCSQSAGHFNIDVTKLNASVVFPGHKGLLGPTGTGVMCLCGIKPRPLCFGGTGSDSRSIYQPEIMPDYYESGTLNLMGIAGLLEGVKFILKEGTKAISQKERKLTKMLREGLSVIKKVTVLAPDITEFGSVVSFTAENIQPSEISLLLDEQFDIATRSGLHCAPMAHKFYNSEKTGTVRLSPGYFNTEKEILITLDAINKIVS